MPSDDGSPGLPARSIGQPVSEERLKEWQHELRQRELTQSVNRVLLGVDVTARLTTEERDRIADGEPYCFRCGKPASSFEAYDVHIDPYEGAPKTRAEAVRVEEGTYNAESNRFACDACYIAIGMPTGGPRNAYGWKAP